MPDVMFDMVHLWLENDFREGEQVCKELNGGLTN
jgi:hypothetical protein